MLNGLNNEVILTIEEYRELYEDSRFLECLQTFGVDNWEGYRDAQLLFQEDAEGNS